MKMRILVLFIVCTLGITPASASGPFIVGEAGELSTGDANRIIAAAGGNGSVWLLEVYDSWFLKPPNLFVKVHFYPETSTSTLRRGRLAWVWEELSENVNERAWKMSGGPMAWAQVASSGHAFDQNLRRPRGLERPFRVMGEISNDDLVDLVKFIRKSPSKPPRVSENPDGWSLEIGADVDGGLAIINVEVKAKCFFEVTTERRRGSGQKIEVSKGESGWEVYSVSEWTV